MNSWNKDKAIGMELKEVFALISGLFLAGDFQGGRRLIQKAFRDNGQFFGQVWHSDLTFLNL